VIHIEVRPSLETAPDLELLERAALQTLKHQAQEGDVTLLVSDDVQLQEMNHKFLHADAPTDVLSFPASETDPETGRNYLGDILLSLPRAAQQAHAAGHALEAELQLLVVHGMLHLLGYDHAGVEEKVRMWAAQTEILEQLGLSSLRIIE